MNSINRVTKTCWILVLTTGVHGVSFKCLAQTPWDAAPALPAALPQAKPSTRVASLPPPPANFPAGQVRESVSGKTTLGKDGLHVPNHVAIPPSLMIDVPTGTGGQAPKIPAANPALSGLPATGAATSKANTGSLVPPSLSLGNRSGNPADNSVGQSSAPAFPQLGYPELPNLGQAGNQTQGQTQVNSQDSLGNLPLPNSYVNRVENRQTQQTNGFPPTAMQPGNGNSVIGNRAVENQATGNLANQPAPGVSGGQSRNSLSGQLVSAPVTKSAPEPGAPNLGVNATAEAVAFQPGELIAVIGTDHVLAGDLTIFVEPIIEKNRDKIPGKEQEDLIRNQLTRQVLREYVVIKAMYQEFFRDVIGTGTPDEAEKTKKMVTKKANELFFQKRVPDLLKQNDATDLATLEEKLREKSISLNLMRDQFIEQALAAEFERKYVPAKMEVDRRELLTYYQNNLDQWKKPARAKWRQLTIRFDEHNDDRNEVDRLIKTLGNEVLDGKPFRAVAEQSSEGYTAADGGLHDFTSKGSLKSKPLDNALFTLPLGRLSQVIVDDVGMHIIEVLEREDQYTVEFSKAQGEIRETLSQQKRSDEIKKLQLKVLARTPIWSKWPEDLREKAKHVRDLSEAIGEQ